MTVDNRVKMYFEVLILISCIGTFFLISLFFLLTSVTCWVKNIPACFNCDQSYSAHQVFSFHMVWPRRKMGGVSDKTWVIFLICSLLNVSTRILLFTFNTRCRLRIFINFLRTLQIRRGPWRQLFKSKRINFKAC